MIPDEAVEAAYEAHLSHKSVRSPGNAKEAMRAALGAAAPYISEQVWDRVPGETERIRAAINLLYPEEMTPTAKRILEQILEVQQ